jgi:hypothetical protein
VETFLVSFDLLDRLVHFLEDRSVLTDVVQVVIDTSRVVFVYLVLVSFVLVNVFSDVSELLVSVLSKLLVIIS